MSWGRSFAVPPQFNGHVATPVLISSTAKPMGLAILQPCNGSARQPSPAGFRSAVRSLGSDQGAWLLRSCRSSLYKRACPTLLVITFMIDLSRIITNRGGVVNRRTGRSPGGCIMSSRLPLIHRTGLEKSYTICPAAPFHGVGFDFSYANCYFGLTSRKCI